MVAIVPRGLFDQLYGFDLGSNGPPIEPAVAGNSLPFFIDSEYPVQQGSDLTVPAVATDDPVEEEEPVDEEEIILPPDDGGNDSGNDEFYDSIFGPNSVDVAPALNAAGRGDLAGAVTDIVGTVPGGGGNFDLGDDDPYYSETTDIASGTGSLGGQGNYVDAALDVIGQTPNPDYAPVDVGNAAPAPTVSELVDGISLAGALPGAGTRASPAEIASIGGIASAPSMSGLNGPQNQSYDQFSSAGPAYGEEMISYAPIDEYEDDMTSLNNTMRDNYNAASAEAIAQQQIANAGVNQRAMAQAENNSENNRLGNEILSGLAGSSAQSPQALAAAGRAQVEATQNQAAQQAATNAAAQQLAGGLANSGVNFGTPAPVEATSRVAQGVSSTVPSTVSMQEMNVPGVNPGNVAGFASRGLGVGHETNLGAAAASRADEAERSRDETAAQAARAGGFTGGMAPGLMDGVSSTARSGFQQIADDDLGAFGLGTPPSLAGPADSRPPGIESFSAGLLGQNGAQALSNPSMSLHDLQQIELSSPTFDPYSETGVQSLGSHGMSRSSSGLTRNDLNAEIDSLNGVGLLGGEYGMERGPSVDAMQGIGPDGNPISGPVDVSYGEDDEDEDEAGGYSGGYGSGFSSPSGVNGISTVDSNSFGGQSFGGQVSASLGGFGNDSSFGGGSFGFGDSFGSDASSAISGFGGGTDAFSNNSFGNDFGNDGGFDGGFGGFGGNDNGGVGGDGSFGGFSDDTSGSFGGPVGSDGSSGGFSDDTGGGAITDAFGNDDNGFGGFT